MKRSKLIVLYLLLFSAIIFAQKITIDLNIEYQTIDGFGGFGPKKVWWDSPPFYDEEYLDMILDDLGCTIVRTQLYWDFEEANDNDDPNLINWNGFNFGPNSDNGKQFPFIMALRDRGLDKFIASVWTPPVWMKLDPDDGLASFCNGQCGGRLNPELYEEFAEYIIAYIKMLKDETDVDLYAISLQNEPLFANPFESCVYKEAELAELVKVVGPRLRKEGLSTKIFGPEHMGSYSWELNFINELMARDSLARENLDIFAVHGYLDGFSADYGKALGWTQLFNACTKYGKPIWMSETSDYETTGWDKAFKMARGLHLALKFGKISAWIYWYMSGDMLNDNVPAPLYYVFKNYYRYIRPGYIQVDSQSDDSEILVTAFRKDEKITIVLINNSLQEKTATLDFGAVPMPKAFQVFQTSRTDNCVDLGVVKNNQFILKANSVTTLYKDIDTSVEQGDGGSSDRSQSSGLHEIEIFPNPTNGFFLIRNAQNSTIQLYNVNGRMVREVHCNKESFKMDLNGLASGIYLVKIARAGDQVFKKISYQK